MPSGLGWHFQAIPSWAQGIVNSTWVKILDPPSTNPFPSCKTVGRVYVSDGEANALIMRGASGADEWFGRCAPSYQRAPWVTAWEGPNEPPVATPEQRAALCSFTARWVRSMHAAGLKTVALCLSVGWPDVGCAPSLANALAETDYWALHEYAAPTLQSQQSWLCLRYRRTVAELQAVGSRIPPLLITECGIDGGVAGRPGVGWKGYCSASEYLNQLAWYDGELGKDSYVQAATIFTSGPNGNWTSFDVDETLSHGLAAYIKSKEGETMSDPRADNCKGYHLNAAGKVDGVLLQYVEKPETKYKLVQVRLIDEVAAGGATVANFAVVNRNGVPVSENVYLAWPWPSIANRLLPGNQNSQHMITNGYDAAAGNIGPLAIYVGDSQGNPISDLIGGLGLPNNRHVSYALTFQERGATPPPNGDGSDAEAIAALHADVKKLAAHLGLQL